MTKALIVVGDTHSHGGNVLGASSKMYVHGKVLVCEGDEAICSLHGRTHVADATSNIICYGRRVARDGDHLACGGVLKASQPPTAM
jgi:uncharacterized Zn-binding protein involved in type VI secretion